MNTELSHVRGVLLDALYQAVDLDIRLLHSTEIQHTVVAREHEAIVGIIERLRKHSQVPHIQQYSPLGFSRSGPSSTSHRTRRPPVRDLRHAETVGILLSKRLVSSACSDCRGGDR